MKKLKHYEFSKPDPKAQMAKEIGGRIQPTCVGADEKGELKWEARRMELWQQLMFPIRYVGDFIAFWYRRCIYEQTGFELEEKTSSMNLEANRQYKKKKLKHTGD